MALGRRNPAHVATARPSGRRNPAHEGYGPAQGQGAASPSPEAGFRGFSRPGSTGLFLIESRGGGLSPAGRVFKNKDLLLFAFRQNKPLKPKALHV